MRALHDKPLASPPLKSYRYAGRYGYIMIGATNYEEALSEARRSTDEEISIANLEYWNNESMEYLPICTED